MVVLGCRVDAPGIEAISSGIGAGVNGRPLTRPARSRSTLLPLRSRGISAVAIDILHMNRHGRQARKVAHEPVHLISQHMGGANADVCRASRRVVPCGQRDVQEPLVLVASDMRVHQRDDRVLEIAQVDHRQLFRRRFRSRSVHAKARDNLYEMIQQSLRVEPGGSLKVFAKPLLRNIQPEMRHVRSLRWGSVARNSGSEAGPRALSQECATVTVTLDVVARLPRSDTFTQ